MTVLVATPATAVSLPVPLTVPAPEALAKATTVVLSVVTVLPAASFIVAVSTRVAPEARSVVAPVRTMSAAAPWTTVKAPRRAGGQARGGRFHGHGANELTGDRLAGDARDGGGVAGARDGAGARGLGKGDDGRVIGGDGVAGRILDRRRQHPRRTGSQVRGRARERDLGGGAVDDGEGAEGAGGEPGGSGFHRDGADEGAGDRLRGDAADGGVVAGARDGAGARGLGERDDGACCRR